MQSKYNHTFNIYYLSAKHVKKHLHACEKSNLLELSKEMPTDFRKKVLNSAKGLTHTDILNYFAIQSGYENWSQLKLLTNLIKQRLTEDRKKYNKACLKEAEDLGPRKFFDFVSKSKKRSNPKNEISEKSLKELAEKLKNPKTFGAITRETNERIGCSIHGANIPNLYLGAPEYTKEADTLFSGDMSWLKIVKCNLQNSLLVGTALTGCDIHDSDFSGSVFSGLPLAIGGNDAYSGRIVYHSFNSKPHLQDALFENCILKNIILSDAYARGAIFNNCEFSNAYLINCNFFESKMRNTNFHNANLCFSDLRLADLSHSNMCGTNLTNVRFAYEEHFASLNKSIKVNSKTIFPSGVKIDDVNNNLNLIEAGLLTNDTATIYFICPQGHKWKKTMIAFASHPFCPKCGKNEAGIQYVKNLMPRIMENFYKTNPSVMEFLSPLQLFLAQETEE